MVFKDMQLHANPLPSTKECSNISCPKLLSAHDVATFTQPCICLSEQHRQVPHLLPGTAWEPILLSAHNTAASEEWRMGKKQLQWKVKDMKNAVFQLLNIFLPTALQPPCPVQAPDTASRTCYWAALGIYKLQREQAVRLVLYCCFKPIIIYKIWSVIVAAPSI